MVPQVNFQALQAEYKDPESESSRKLRLVDSYIPGGQAYLDIGAGTGEMLELQRAKFRRLCGTDVDGESIGLLKKRFGRRPEYHIRQCGFTTIGEAFRGQFDCVTCLDVLEHIPERQCPDALEAIRASLKPGGLFVFSGPGVFEKVRIAARLSPTHLHSHTSYGWKALIERAGFRVTSVETVHFPVIDSALLRKRVHLLGMCCVIVARKTGE